MAGSIRCLLPWQHEAGILYLVAFYNLRIMRYVNRSYVEAKRSTLAGVSGKLR